VFLYPDSSISIIVEVLERVAEDDDEEAVKFCNLSISLTGMTDNDFPRFHFSSLAKDNSAEASSVESVTKLPKDKGDDTPSPIVLQGTQLVRKFNSPVPDRIRILLAAFRIKSKNVDLVLSMNIPLETVEGKVDDAKHKQAQLDFDTAVKSLRILDLGLFL